MNIAYLDVVKSFYSYSVFFFVIEKWTLSCSYIGLFL